MKYFIFCKYRSKRSARKKEPDYDEDENQVEEEETRELNHFWAGSNILISYTIPLIFRFLYENADFSVDTIRTSVKHRDISGNSIK